jgi:hypothetical protein
MPPAAVEKARRADDESLRFDPDVLLHPNEDLREVFGLASRLVELERFIEALGSTDYGRIPSETKERKANEWKPHGDTNHDSEHPSPQDIHR